MKSGAIVSGRNWALGREEAGGRAGGRARAELPIYRTPHHVQNPVPEAPLAAWDIRAMPHRPPTDGTRGRAG